MPPRKWVFLAFTTLPPQNARGQASGPLDGLRNATLLSFEYWTDSGEVTGSCVMIAANGAVATATHVIRGARRAKVKIFDW